MGADIALRTVAGLGIFVATVGVACLLVALLPYHIFRQVPPALTAVLALVIWRPFYGYALERLRLRPAPLRFPPFWSNRLRKFHGNVQLTLWIITTMGAVWTYLHFGEESSFRLFIVTIVFGFIAVFELLLFLYIRQRFTPSTPANTAGAATPDADHAAVR